jgi:hypothetical protein
MIVRKNRYLMDIFYLYLQEPRVVNWIPQIRPASRYVHCGNVSPGFGELQQTPGAGTFLPVDTGWCS